MSLVHDAFMALRKYYRSLRGSIGDADEAKKLGEQRLFIRGARDLDTKGLLAFRASFTRSGFDAELFLKDLPQFYENKPIIFVDKGRWYRNVLEKLD